ncbi:hypothetical protein EVAR_80649_1 [Eumeta japonica]|uniref:Uncharacterized protein n=1 Tax=Eumeta variegata TaxID=151549 RepID=A0A4C1YVF8_EUMVA|nr:hypothetical protein EVAR_80649_1 [Eumeta japonica]
MGGRRRRINTTDDRTLPRSQRIRISRRSIRSQRRLFERSPNGNVNTDADYDGAINTFGRNPRAHAGAMRAGSGMSQHRNNERTNRRRSITGRHVQLANDDEAQYHGTLSTRVGRTGRDDEVSNLMEFTTFM